MHGIAGPPRREAKDMAATSPSKRSGSRLCGFRLYLGVPLRARPAGPSHGGEGEEPGAIAHDLLLPGACGIGPGSYRIRIGASAGGRAPVVVAGEGPQGGRSKTVPLRPAGGGLEGSFSLDHPVDCLRLDGAAGVTGGRLRRLTQAEAHLRTGLGVLAHQHRHGRSPAWIARQAFRVLLRDGIGGVAFRLRRLGQRAELYGASYAHWIATREGMDEDYLDRLRERVAALASRPTISVLMPVHDTQEQHLRAAIDSVLAQVYPEWELCIADDASTAPWIAGILSEYEARDPRIRIVRRAENGHICAASNSAFALAGGEWIALLDHDDILRPHALAEMALEIDRHPQAELLYSDEDKIGPDGRRFDPFFKPDFSRELFRSQNYLNHLTVHRAANIRAVGGWRPGFEGSQDYDLSLRILERIDPANIRHVPKILYHWRTSIGSTALTRTEKDYAWEAGLRALREHVERTGLAASAEAAPDTPFYRIRLGLPEPRPLVSLVIPTRDQAALLRNCIGSILDRTTYDNVEILVVDNGSVERETLDYFDELRALPNVRILSWDRPFNYSAINNFAVGQASGPIVGLVNNDIEVISPGWLDEMVSWAIQPDIGCVGAKLYYADDRIQHAGVILGLGGVAGHSHKYFPRGHPGYFHRLALVQNLSAVTGACLVVRKEVYEKVGGLNEEDLTVAFNDVDFCLRVREAGFGNVWTPYAELYHLESISRGAEDDPEKARRFRSEIAYMKDRWHLIPDPFYSPNLTLDREDFSLGD